MRYDPTLFEDAGALRDISISGVGVAEWKRVLHALVMTGWDLQFSSTLDGEPGLDSAIDALFDEVVGNPDASAALAVRVGAVTFRCYFFDSLEIEFTFDPEAVSDAAKFDDVVTFMSWLGDASGGRVIMTMEGTDHVAMPALLEYVPYRCRHGEQHVAVRLNDSIVTTVHPEWPS
ncbi:hypothetical protein [Cellulomonas sp.]|uniref:hypothetical protein n=1 Tax=Cellulomonas sp. TaxID=40001 RepID=UPI003BABC288